ncbi:MAG: hypothetical protein RL318_2079 [Fibrobacterota bacterium]|jgi:ABC-type lipoprotein release transport system permease subunit
MLLARLAFRNIGRHLRRSLFLGSAIALGTAVLVAANGFAHGISVVLFDKVMVFVAGHAGVFASESGSQQTQIFRDGTWLRQKLAALPEVRRVDEAVGVFARALGNGKSDNTILVGIDTRQLADSKDRAEFEETFRIVQGSWQAMNDSTIPLPTLLGVDKAKALNVKLGDQVRLRFSNVNGQNQAGKATVVGIFETDNMFMQAPMYVGLARLRDLMGYRPDESSGFNLVLHNPKEDARRVADTIQSFMVPQVASIPSRLGGAPVRLFGLKSDSATRAQWMKGLSVPDSLLREKNLVVIPTALSVSQKLGVGDTFSLAWPLRYGTDSGRTTLIVSSIAPAGKLPDSVIAMRSEGFFRTYNSQIPKRQNLSPAFDTSWAVREWNLLPRAATTDEYRKQMAELSFARGLGPVVSVRTMYEAASDILKLENVLNVVTLWAVLVLFFIILIGVLNTLRMTIRERTREIGTLRAIGFQARQVLGLFLFETLYLAVFSGLVGVVLGFGLMELLSSFTIHASGNPMGVLLVNSHLYFSPTVTGTLGGVVLIAILSLLTAWLPARAAAKLSPADALRHHE